MIFRRAERGWAGPFAALALLLGSTLFLFAQVKDLPPKPDRYITDQAGVLNSVTLDSINAQLDQFERATSNQVVVYILPNLPPDADIAQYATYTYNAWGIGQKDSNNGVLFLIAINDHKLFIAPGRGLEGALPDATCKNIITRIITPAFRSGDYAGGIEAGINAIFLATKGEYHGTGATVADSGGGSDQGLPPWAVILIIVIFIIIISSRGGGGFGGPIIYSSGGWGGGYGGGGGGWSGGSGGGGGFSGGGGSSSGGGAGGSW
jgi:uncharacterized protein